MAWQTTPEPSPSRASHRGRGLIRAGAVLAGLGLLGVVVCGVQVAMHLGSPIADALSSPAFATPLDRSLALEASDYAVFELTGHTSGNGGVRFTERGPTTLTPADVQVTGPDGRDLPTRRPGGGTQTLTRGQELYTAAVYVTVPQAGRYRVVVDNGQTLQVVVSRSITSGLAGIKGPLLGTGGALLVLLIGLVMLVVGLVRRPRRVAAAGPFAAPGPGNAGRTVGVVMPQAPPGWYPDPVDPRQRRFWDGRAWTAPPPADRPPG